MPWDTDTSRAEAAGLRCRPLRETVRDTWAWMAADGGAVRRSYRPRRPHGLSEEKERALFAAWDARSGKEMLEDRAPARKISPTRTS